MTMIDSSPVGAWYSTGSQIRQRIVQDVIIQDTSGLVIGHTSRHTAANTPLTQIIGTGSDDGSILIARHTGGAQGPLIELVKGAHNTIGNFTIVDDDDQIGNIIWFPADGFDYETQAAEFRAEVDDAAPAAGDIGMAFVWTQMAGDAAAGRETMRLAANGTLFLGETVHTGMTVGLTINQGANDDLIFALKSSDVGHGATTLGGHLSHALEVDDYFTIAKRTATGGATMQVVLADEATTQVLQLIVAGGTATTAKTTAARGLVHFSVMEHDGINGVVDTAADGNLFSIATRRASATVAIFMVDEDGDLHAGNATVATFDEYDDAAMLRAFATTDGAAGVIRTEFDRFVRYQEANLVDAKILGAPLSEGGMWNINQHARWLNGAAWQAVEDIMSIVQVLSPDQRKKLTPRLQERLALMEAA